MPNLSTKDGVPTGGVYGFSAMSLELIKKYDPDYVAVAWDKPKTNIRKRLKIFHGYKSGRKPAPPDFYAQIPILHDVLKAFGWPLYELDDYEADDIMHTLARKADKAGLDTMLITSDMDSLQSISAHTKVYALKKGFSNIEEFDINYFEQKHGIEVEQFLDLKSLKGDSSDSIPGVPGVGEKTAISLLQQYKTLDGIYENVMLLKDSVRKKLEAGKESAYMSRDVAQLYDDAPVELELERMDTRDLDTSALRKLLTELEFRSLLRNLPEYMQARDDSGEIEQTSINISKKDTKPLKINLIDNRAGLKDIKFPDTIVVDSFCKKSHGREPRYLVLADRQTVNLIDIEKIGVDSLQELDLKLKQIEVIGYDTKSFCKVLLELNIKIPKVSHDVLVGAFLINSIRRERTLSELAFSDLGYEGSGFEDLSPDEFVGRIGERMAVIWGLYDFQSESVSELTDIIKLMDQVEWPVIPVLARMEYRGMKLDKQYLLDMSGDLEGKISDIEQTIYGLADTEFNISSPAQLSDVLFGNLSLPTELTKKGKSGHYSTASDVLAKLKSLHPIVENIEKYREYTKLKNTYVDTLPKLADSSGRVHTTFSLTTASTGRLSSLNPNLQNIPVRTELGRKIRTAFVAEKGKVFIGADYSQFELRIAAALSGDKDMIKAFDDDQDIHQLTAASVIGIDPDKVTKEMRYRAKAVNFGILYGQGPHALAEQTGMTFAEAKDFISTYFTVRPKLKEFIEHTRAQAKDKGFVETVMGRRRPTPDVVSSNFMVRESAYRQAINMPIQGSAADLTKLAMVQVQAVLPEDADMLLQIHDSIMVECRQTDADKLAERMKGIMEGVYPQLGVRLKVDVEIGRNWGEI